MMCVRPNWRGAIEALAHLAPPRRLLLVAGLRAGSRRHPMAAQPARVAIGAQLDNVLDSICRMRDMTAATIRTRSETLVN
jgi:hypothetical protein